jgi:hypothetical protein
MSKQTGGAAFPRSGNEWEGMEWVPSPDQTGMTLRDYFAAKAMQRIMASSEFTNTETFEEDANVAYQMADAMLKAREQ